MRSHRTAKSPQNQEMFQVCVCVYKANSKHWFTTSFLWRKVPESDARSVLGCTLLTHKAPIAVYRRRLNCEKSLQHFSATVPPATAAPPRAVGHVMSDHPLTGRWVGGKGSGGSIGVGGRRSGLQVAECAKLVAVRVSRCPTSKQGQDDTSVLCWQIIINESYLNFQGHIFCLPPPPPIIPSFFLSDFLLFPCFFLFFPFILFYSSFFPCSLPLSPRISVCGCCFFSYFSVFVV